MWRVKRGAGQVSKIRPDSHQFRAKFNSAFLRRDLVARRNFGGTLIFYASPAFLGTWNCSPKIFRQQDLCSATWNSTPFSISEIIQACSGTDQIGVSIVRSRPTVPSFASFPLKCLLALKSCLNPHKRKSACCHTWYPLLARDQHPVIVAGAKLIMSAELLRHR